MQPAQLLLQIRFRNGSGDEPQPAVMGLFIDQGTQLTDIVTQQVRDMFIHIHYEGGMKLKMGPWRWKWDICFGGGMKLKTAYWRWKWDICFEGGMKLKKAYQRWKQGPVPFAHRA
jgi:hypothetical protein